MNTNKGFSLFEVLVAMTLISIGLLGVLAMTVKSMRLQQESYYAVIAEQQLENIIEMLRESDSSKVSLFNKTLSDWNILNKKLLPHANGKLENETNAYKISLEWDSRIKWGTINRLCLQAVL